MDVEQSNRAPVAFRESCRAALYTILLLTSPITLSFAILLFAGIVDRWRSELACCIAAGAILGLVRWLNHREAPRRVKTPAAIPDNAPESD